MTLVKLGAAPPGASWPGGTPHTRQGTCSDTTAFHKRMLGPSHSAAPCSLHGGSCPGQSLCCSASPSGPRLSPGRQRGAPQATGEARSGRVGALGGGGTRAAPGLQAWLTLVLLPTSGGCAALLFCRLVRASLRLQWGQFLSQYEGEARKRAGLPQSRNQGTFLSLWGDGR